MQVKLLQSYIEQFQAYVSDRRFRPHYAWESLAIFQKHWDIDAPDLAKMYDQSLQNSQSKRLWKTEQFKPKAVLLQLIPLQADLARLAFRKLFNEAQAIDDRLAHFKFCCDELLSTYKQQHPTSIENNHYHDDNHMLFLYLSFRYPTQYTLFDYPRFREALSKLGTVDLPGPHDLERFVKISRAMDKFLQRQESLWPSFRRYLDSNRDFQSYSMLCVFEFYKFVSDQRA